MQGRRYRLVVAVAVALAAIGCSSADESAAPSPTTTRAAATTTTTARAAPSTGEGPDGNGTTGVDGAITAVDFRNFKLRYPSVADDSGKLDDVTVTDGEYSSGTPPDTFHFEVDDVDFADLDGDGVAEAAISIYYNTGGSGQFTDALIYRWADGAARYVTDVGVGDRGDGGVDGVSIVAAPNGAVGNALVVRRNADPEGACCPTALEERTFRLDGDKLHEVGRTQKWGIVRVGVDAEGNPTSDPTVVKFLKGTSRADLTGDATAPVAATFDAHAGQTLQVTLDAKALADNPIVVEVSGPDGAIGRLGTGFDPTINVVLQTAGTYRLQFDPVAPAAKDVGFYFDADLRIS